MIGGGMYLGYGRRRFRGKRSSVVVLDTFTRADNAVSLGNAETGQAWTVSAGATFGVVGGRGYMPGGAAYFAARVSAGVADGRAKITIAVVQASGVVARLSDDSNYLYVEHHGAATTLYKRVAGAFTSLGSWANTPANGDVIELECRGSTLNVYVNGVLRITATDAFNSALMAWGFSTNNATTRFDNFSVVR